MIKNLPDEESIFKVACQVPSPAARAAYLQQVCGDDPAMFARLQALLRARLTPGDWASATSRGSPSCSA